ncbi:MAG: hypothetical protein ACK4ZW_05775 [Blastomonas sp.]
MTRVIVHSNELTAEQLEEVRQVAQKAVAETVRLILQQQSVRQQPLRRL